MGQNVTPGLLAPGRLWQVTDGVDAALYGVNKLRFPGATVTQGANPSEAVITPNAPVSTPIAAGATIALTPGQSGSTILLNHSAGGSAATLPAATGSGAKYKFIVTAVPGSGAHIIKTNSGSDVYKGYVQSYDTTLDTTALYSAAAGNDEVSLDGLHKGGATVGDTVEVTDIAAGQWAITAFLTATTTSVTPFSTV